jgi:hypothetical protein
MSPRDSAHYWLTLLTAGSSGSDPWTLGAQAPFDRFRVLAQVKHGDDDRSRGFHCVENAVRMVRHEQLSVYSSVGTTDSGVAAQQADATIQLA